LAFGVKICISIPGPGIFLSPLCSNRLRKSIGRRPIKTRVRNSHVITILCYLKDFSPRLCIHIYVVWVVCETESRWTNCDNSDFMWNRFSRCNARAALAQQNAVPRVTMLSIGSILTIIAGSVAMMVTTGKNFSLQNVPCSRQGLDSVRDGT